MSVRVEIADRRSEIRVRASPARSCPIQSPDRRLRITAGATAARGCFPRSPISDLRSRQSGFTLIELVAAFVIFALAFGVLLQILGGSLHTTAQSVEYTKAAMWAQTVLDTQGIGEPLQEGSDSGRFDDRYSWQLNVRRYEPPPVTTTVAPLTTPNAGGLITAPVTPLDLFQLELVVSWGTPYLVHHARFTTVRVMNPPLEAGNTLAAPPPIRARQ